MQSDEIDSETFADTFEAMSADKIEGYCQIIRQLSADEGMFKAEIDRLNKHKKVCENAQARLKQRLIDYLTTADVDRIKAGTFTVSVSSTPSVNITDEEKIPNEYRIAQPYKIDKNAIKTALRTDITVPGAEIVYTKGVRIR
ncbi:MAG: siphovirus Gp157 family protein [Clostridia bacterium]|nr:siphovirus Gp157 family protein [Clostridia bacterium]